MKMLKKIKVSSDIFLKILEGAKQKKVLTKTSEINKYEFGFSKEEGLFFYNGINEVVTYEFVLEYELKDFLLFNNNFFKSRNNWIQCIVVLDESLSNKTLISDITGSMAWEYFIKLLNKYYSKDEINERFMLFQSDYDENKAQQHYLNTEEGKILKFKNCYAYDINGAHCDALREIFPKAEKEIENVYLNRKINPALKAYANYFVGMLCRMGYRKTYNWIVQRTTNILNNGIKECNGKLIYANTDGFIVQNPKKKIKDEKNVLGKYKLEYSGIVYTYQGENYEIHQRDVIKGSVFSSLRDKIDLSKGNVVEFTIKQEFGIRIPENIKEKKVKIYEI